MVGSKEVSNVNAPNLVLLPGDFVAENQKGINAFQRCSLESQKGAITIDFVQR